MCCCHLLQLHPTCAHSGGCTRIAERSVAAVGGRCVFLLEGGYDLKALGEAVADTFTGLLGAPSIDKFNPDLLRDEPRDKADFLLKGRCGLA